MAGSMCGRLTARYGGAVSEPVGPRIGPLVTVGWVAERLDRAELVVLDASLGDQPEETLHIPGARRFDIDGALSDRSSHLPHTMPDPGDFQREMRALGVNSTSTVVVYDGAGIYSSARAWWMLRAMGFDRVGVLDGGRPAWIAAGLPLRPVESIAPPPGDFVAMPREQMIVDIGEVAAALSDGACAVLDARAEDRFAGRAPEPRPGLRSGHMPGSVNLPFACLVVDGHMRSPDELRALFSDLVGQRERLVLSCGSGVTACILALGAELAGYRDLAVYDGSWSEWGLPGERPVVTS